MMEEENIPILDLKAQYALIREEVMAAVERVMESQQFILGPEVESLEREISGYSQCKYGIGTSSGTDALLVSMMALGIKPGDEVITSPYSFFATAGCITRLGARPVFVDVDPDTMNIDPNLVEDAITDRTRLLLPVHLAGQMADMGSIMDIATRHHLHVIEDACQALGAEFQGKRAGSIGDLGCFSFFPSKNLGGAGDGGMVVTNDPGLVDKVALLRNHGHRPKYFNKVVGGNFRMDALQAAILRVKFQYLETWTSARQAIASSYRQLFLQADLASEEPAKRQQMPVILPQETGWGRHIYHLFQVRAKNRDGLKDHLRNQGIGTEIYYPQPLHRQECYRDLGYQEMTLPYAEELSRQCLSIPIFPELSMEQINRVVSSIQDFYQ